MSIINHSINCFKDFLNNNGNDELKEKFKNYIVEYRKNMKKYTKKLENKNKGFKKAKTAYNIYCSKIRKTIIEENPNLTHPQLFKEMAKRWGVIKNDEKLVSEYFKLANEDRDRYLEDKNKYLSQNKKKNFKRAKSGYMFFCEDERKNITVKGRDVLKELGRIWKELNDNGDERVNYYNDLSEKDKLRIQNEKDLLNNTEEKQIEPEKSVEIISEEKQVEPEKSAEIISEEKQVETKEKPKKAKKNKK